MSTGRLTPADVCGVDPPSVREFTNEDLVRLWPQASRELRGYAAYLENTQAKLTASQMRMALQMADESYDAVKACVDPPPSPLEGLPPGEVATHEHIRQVQGFLIQVQAELRQRATDHDRSKLESPEKEMFEEYTPKLKALVAGSSEYEACRQSMGEALQLHYARNRHHPEFHRNGWQDMNLLDVIEMLADWKASTLRHDDGDLGRSIESLQSRFGYDDTFKGLLYRTARDLGWLPAKPKIV